MMLSLPDRPTAIFCTNDTIAVGTLKAALRAGLRIPQDLAIVGFDDSEISHLVEPELTTVRVDKAAMGRIAAEQLIAQIEGELPKGLDRNTIKRVWEHILEQKDEFTAEEMANYVGLSPVSIRKYLKYFQSVDLLHVEISYGAVGSPVYRYRCNRNR